MDCEHCTNDRIIEEILKCDFECEGGMLKNHRGWKALVDRVKIYEKLYFWERGSFLIGMLIGGLVGIILSWYIIFKIAEV